MSTTSLLRSFSYTVVCLLLTTLTKAQSPRLNDHNRIGWYSNFFTIPLGGKWGLHAEYQWRRDNLITDWQQSQLRTGLNYQAHPRLLLRAGYVFVRTYNYGDIPIQAAGKPFDEHRTFQMAQLTDKIGRPELTHRFMLEQRWVGRYSQPTLDKQDGHTFTNRARYQFRLQIPLNKPKTEPGTFYLAGYDEIFLNFGTNVQNNVFDQNRVALMAGYQFSKLLRVEGGFLNQTVQFGRRINNQNVFQYNNGVILSGYWNFSGLGNTK